MNKIWITLLEHRHLQFQIDETPILNDHISKVYQLTHSELPYGLRVNGAVYNHVKIKNDNSQCYVYDIKDNNEITTLGAVELITQNL